MPRTNSSPPLLTEQDKRYYDQHPNALWVWKAKPGTCVDCTARDGRKYRYEDIPERPHTALGGIPPRTRLGKAV